jgi:hypothetical protein
MLLCRLCLRAVVREAAGHPRSGPTDLLFPNLHPGDHASEVRLAPARKELDGPAHVKRRLRAQIRQGLAVRDLRHHNAVLVHRQRGAQGSVRVPRRRPVAAVGTAHREEVGVGLVDGPEVRHAERTL